MEIFATLYEWFGLIPFYSKDMGDYLRGYDATCTGYIDTPWYVYIGFCMIGLTILIFTLAYHIVDSVEYNKAKHWWLYALVLVLLNFFIAFDIPYNSLQAGDYCNQLNLSVSDCVGFGFSNGIWSLLLFALISSISKLRQFSSVNWRHTTFWKP